MNGNGAARRIRWITTVVLFFVGVVLVVISLTADSIGLNFTSGFGIIQMTQLLVGISCLTLAGFIHIKSLRDPEVTSSLQADIGVRISATGLVFCYVSGLSDLLQIGTHLTPCSAALLEAGENCGPFVGPWQLAGIVVGVFGIIVGLLLYYTSRGTRSSSLLEFVIQDDEATVAVDPESETSPEK